MIKNLFFYFFIICFLSGCSVLEENGSKSKKEIVQEKMVQDYVDPYIDDNPIELGLYVYQNKVRTLKNSYDGDFIKGQDIVSFEVYYTKDEILTGNQKSLWNQYYKNYQDIDSYKIGYYISFQVGEETYEKLILRPSDTGSIFDYVQIYLYDDIHQESGWYDHVDEVEMKDETILTSIKLTSSTNIDKITSPITLMAFTYDGEDDFDVDNRYRGNSFAEVIVNRN